MQMKDKLYKNHHKGLYYKARRVGLVSVVVFSGIIAVSVPTYINITREQAALAEKEKQEEEIIEENNTFEMEETPLKDRIQTYRDELLKATLK